MTVLGASLLGALEALVLVRQADGQFARWGAAPKWCSELGAAELDGDECAPFSAEAPFPFLESFLPEGEEVWRTEGKRPRADSEFWTQVTPSGEELHLKALALRVGSSDVLVITRDDRAFEERQLVLQRARELRAAHATLESEIEQRDVLVHCIVHDLATPLHSMLATLALLSEQPLEEPRARWIALALEAAKRQRDMIQTILYVFSAERDAPSARLDAATGSADVVTAISRVASELEPIARRRRVRLEVVPVELPPPACRVIGDDARLSRVIANLVDNALRHSPEGGTVRIRCERSEGTVRVAVEDEGPGVPLDLAPHLFQKFGRRKGTAGTGLGLYFCRITAERWGGGVGYEPLPEGGSRFWVRLREA